MPARIAPRPRISRIAALLPMLIALPLAASAAEDMPFPGVDREHLQLPLDMRDWRVRFEDDGDSATWYYRPATPEVARRTPSNEITVAALDKALAPFPAREMPQRTHAMLAAHAPGLVLDIRSGDAGDRVVYVLSTGQPTDTTIVALALDGTSALHTAEIELRAGTAKTEIAGWVDVLQRAKRVPGAD